MMSYSRWSEDRIGGQRPPRKEVEGLPDTNRRGNRMRPKPGLPKSGAKPGKVTEKQRIPLDRALATDCLMPGHAYLDVHDGPFPLPKHLCGAAGQFLRAGRTDAGRFAAA